MSDAGAGHALVEKFFLRAQNHAIVQGNCLDLLPTIPPNSINATVTSPPYFSLKTYDCEGQIGWKQSRDEYLHSMHLLLAGLMAATAPNGCCFIIIGDTYKRRTMQLIPQRIALLADEIGWTVRNTLIWWKCDAAPESVTDRWRYSHEDVLFLVKSPRGYSFDLDSIRIPYSDVTMKRWGKGQTYGGGKAKDAAGPAGQKFKRGRSFRLNPKGAIPPDVLHLPTSRCKLSHYATFPRGLVELLVMATTNERDIVLDPFVGSGTSGVVAISSKRRFLGFDLNAEYVALATGECEAAFTLLESTP